MTVTIKKTDTPEDIDKKVAKVIAGLKKGTTSFQADKYVGKLKGLYGNPLTFQNKMRDEWSRWFISGYKYIHLHFWRESNASASLTNKTIYYSFISELELLGVPEISDAQKKIVHEALDEGNKIYYTKSINRLTIELKREKRIKSLMPSLQQQQLTETCL